MARSRIIFLDGRMVEVGAKIVDALAPGVVSGRGVFETMRVHQAKISLLEDHLTRLSKGLKILRVRAPYSKKQLRQYLNRVVRVNHFKEARLRLAVWKEQKRTRIAIVGQAFKGYSRNQYDKGFKAVISSIRRPKTRFSHIKSMDYGCFRRAFMEAKKKKYDEAILLNSRKEIVEGSRTNVFFIKGDVLYTPATHCGCLNGITRQAIIRSARQLHVSCKPIAAGVQRLVHADEAFVTNSLLGVMPLTSLGGKQIGRGKAGPLTQKLLSIYRTNVHSSCSAHAKSV